jgi:hypothetical protein
MVKGREAGDDILKRRKAGEDMVNRGRSRRGHGK